MKYCLPFLQKKTKSHRKDGLTSKTTDVTLDSTVTSQNQKQAFVQIKANKSVQTEPQQSITEINREGDACGESQQSIKEAKRGVRRNDESQQSTVEQRKLNMDVESQQSIE